MREKKRFLVQSIHKFVELANIIRCRSCEEAGANHLVSVLGLLALSVGIPSHLGDLLLLIVLQVESVLLVAGHRKLVLVGDLAVEPTVLNAVLAHLKVAAVLTALVGFAVHLFAHANERRLELIDGNLAVIIQIELLHEHLDFLFEWWEPVSLGQKLLNLIRGDSSATIAVNTAERRLELLVGEDVNAQCVNEVGLEGVRCAQRRDSEESHLLL